MTSKVFGPTLSIHGTSFDALIDQRINAKRDIDNLRKALAEMAPHGRDYVYSGSEAFAKAQENHQKMLHALKSIEAIVTAQVDDLIEQQSDIKSRL